jgi:signal transduction histidine kinase
MRERVRAHGGTFQVTSSPGMGTTVTVDIPFDPDSSPGTSPSASPSVAAE